MIIPPRLCRGDEIRIVAPSRSMGLLSEEVKASAVLRLSDLGFVLSYGDHVDEKDEWISSSVSSRVKDIHAAFSDPNVKAVLAVIGGFNANQLLEHLDYDLIRNNPKIFCGYSDTTVLQNAIYAKTGLVTYSGPSFSSFGMQKGFEYTQEHFLACLTSSDPLVIAPSSTWSDDAWYIDQEARIFIPNTGYETFQSGTGEGVIIGGNLCTLNLLQGTQYMPSLKNALLFLEDDEEGRITNFDRDLQSLMHLPDFSSLQGIVIGRFQNKSEIELASLKRLLAGRLPNIPVIANADFGHTSPMFTFPIGGYARLHASEENVSLEILRH